MKDAGAANPRSLINANRAIPDQACDALDLDRPLPGVSAAGKSARAVKNLSLAEDHFADHFPGYPVMPASLILEGLAQTGGILVGEANDFREKVVLAKVPRARFHREVLAGEQLIYEVEMLHLRPEGALRCRAGSGVDGRAGGRGGDLLRPPRSGPLAAAVRRPQFRLQRRAEVACWA